MPPDSTESAAAVPQPSSGRAYLVLARKYRPQTFADLTGQEHVVRTLTNALKSGRVAHAFLFCGPRGCGKTTSARILARALNCKGPDGNRQGPAEEPCGVCGPCTEIAAGIDVDVQEIDAASNNGVDDVRQLREAARYLPARDRYKIYIVDEVHMLSSAAFNALLKTLEEPPGHIKFLLATTDPQKLPATILSRVQRHNFQLVPLGKIVARLREISLAEKVSVSDGALSLVARQAAGSMRDGLSLLDQLLSAHDPAAGEIGDREAAEILGALDARVAADAIGAVLRRDAAGALSAVVRAYSAGAEMKRFAEELASHARDLLLAQLGGVPMDLPDHELRELKSQAAESDQAQLSRVFELLQASQDEVSRSPSPRHAIEVALLRCVHLAPSSGIPELLARAEQLAGKLGGVAPAAPPPETVLMASRARSRAALGLARACPATRSRWSAGAVRDGARNRRTDPAPPAASVPPAADRSVSAAACAVRRWRHRWHPTPSGSATIAAAERRYRRASHLRRKASSPPPSSPPPPRNRRAAAARLLRRSTSSGCAGVDPVAAGPIEETWKRLVESMRAMRKGMLTAMLEQSVPLELSPALVVLDAAARAGADGAARRSRQPRGGRDRPSKKCSARSRRSRSASRSIRRKPARRRASPIRKRKRARGRRMRGLRSGGSIRMCARRSSFSAARSKTCGTSGRSSDERAIDRSGRGARRSRLTRLCALPLRASERARAVGCGREARRAPENQSATRADRWRCSRESAQRRSTPTARSSSPMRCRPISSRSCRLPAGVKSAPRPPRSRPTPRCSRIAATARS